VALGGIGWEFRDRIRVLIIIEANTK
jgi:hypothetical protein